MTLTSPVSTRWYDGVATVLITGELDLGTREVVTEAIDEGITTAPNGVIIDLSETEFMDSSGISVLLKGRREADRAGSPTASPGALRWCGIEFDRCAAVPIRRASGRPSALTPAPYRSSR